MKKVSQMTGIKAVNYSVVHAGKTFADLDQIIAEATEHEDRYFGGMNFNLICALLVTARCKLIY